MNSIQLISGHINKNVGIQDRIDIDEISNVNIENNQTKNVSEHEVIVINKLDQIDFSDPKNRKILEDQLFG